MGNGPYRHTWVNRTVAALISPAVSTTSRLDQIRSNIAAPLTPAGVSSLGQPFQMVSRARSPDPTKPSELVTVPGAWNAGPTVPDLTVTTRKGERKR